MTTARTARARKNRPRWRRRGCQSTILGMTLTRFQKRFRVYSCRFNCTLSSIATVDYRRTRLIITPANRNGDSRSLYGFLRAFKLLPAAWAWRTAPGGERPSYSRCAGFLVGARAIVMPLVLIFRVA